MKTISLLMFALLCSATGASTAGTTTYRYACDTADGKCKAPHPPKPPRAPHAPEAPPAPPTAYAPHPPTPPDVPAVPALAPLAPLPPLPPTDAMHPAPPPPPMPPAPPPMPTIPSAAHAACHAKAPGAELSFTVRPGAVMQGSCVRKNGKMRFDLHSYTIED
ncbi:MAG: hypothetical protein V4857_11885 [Pseudomonadota bacterium]